MSRRRNNRTNYALLLAGSREGEDEGWCYRNRIDEVNDKKLTVVVLPARFTQKGLFRTPYNRYPSKFDLIVVLVIHCLLYPLLKKEGHPIQFFWSGLLFWQLAS